MTRFPQTITTNQLPNHMREFRKHIRSFSRLPLANYFLDGKGLEQIYAVAIGGTATDDNSFVDVKRGDIGWQVKSTKQHTHHLVLRRSSVEDRFQKIESAKRSSASRNALGTELLEEFNGHIRDSLEKHELNRMGYFHTKFLLGNEVEVTEAVFTPGRNIFNPNDFYWEWSNVWNDKEPARGKPALLGIHLRTNTPWFSWYGQGQNHFHLNREQEWLSSTCQSINRYRFNVIPKRQRLNIPEMELAVSSATEAQEASS